MKTINKKDRLASRALPWLVVLLAVQAQAQQQQAAPPLDQPQIRGVQQNQPREGTLGFQKAQGATLGTTPSSQQAAPQGVEAFRQAAIKMAHFDFQKSGEMGVIIPPGENPALLQGTEKSFSRNQLQKLFANGRPDVEIYKILKQLPKKNSRQAKYFLRDRITEIVTTSSDNDAHECARTERLMCFVLNRSLEVSDIIDSFADRRQPGILDQEVRVMKESLALSASYYTDILAFIHAPETEQNKAWTPNYREFGEKYAKIFMKANESVLASQAQYNAAFTILAYFQYDLMRDLNADLNKEAAKTLYETLDQLPKPDEPDSSTSIQRLNNLRTLWDGYYTAIEILHKFAPGSPAHPAVPAVAQE